VNGEAQLRLAVNGAAKCDEAGFDLLRFGEHENLL